MDFVLGKLQAAVPHGQVMESCARSIPLPSDRSRVLFFCSQDAGPDSAAQLREKHEALMGNMPQYAHHIKTFLTDAETGEAAATEETSPVSSAAAEGQYLQFFSNALQKAIDAHRVSVS